jgi:hypothetical protein
MELKRALLWGEARRISWHFEFGTETALNGKGSSDKADAAVVMEGDFREIAFGSSPQGEGSLSDAVRNELRTGESSTYVPLGEGMAGVPIGVSTMGGIHDVVAVDELAFVGGPNATELISDFDGDAGDVIDLTVLLDGSSVASVDSSDLFGQPNVETTNIVQVDGNGATNVFDYATVTCLYADAGLKILYDEDLTVTVSHTS